MVAAEQKIVDAGLAEKVKAFHMGDPELTDPHPLFDAMRESCPVARSEATGGYWVMTRYEDVHRALKDPSTFSSRVVAVPEIEGERGKLIPLNYDPPEHTVYRNEFAPWFSPGVVARAEPGARERFVGYLEHFVENGGGDFIEAVAVPFPCVTFLLTLGLPLEDMDQLIEWKDYLIRTLLAGVPEDIAFVLEQILPKINNYFQEKIEERTALTDRPDDVLTYLVDARRGDVPFTLEEKVQTLMLFFQAGLDTVTGTLGYFMNFLATHPEHMQQLIDEPELIPNACEELMRYFSIVTLARKVMKTVEVEGVTIPEGDLCVFLTQSAGRDELQYENANVVDFRRTPIRHLALGGGPHRCLGSHLARMELKVALEEVVRIMPHFEIDPNEQVINHWGAVGGVDYLPLVVK